MRKTEILLAMGRRPELLVQRVVCDTISAQPTRIALSPTVLMG